MRSRVPLLSPRGATGSGLGDAYRQRGLRAGRVLWAEAATSRVGSGGVGWGQVKLYARVVARKGIEKGTYLEYFFRA